MTNPADSADAFSRALEMVQAAHTQLVRFVYCDFSGVTRTKAIHVSQLARKLHEGIGLTRAQMAINLLEQLIAVPGMEPVGEIRLVPDPNTLTILPWTVASASIVCDQLGHDHYDWGACPRIFLKKMVERAAQQGIAVEAAFENEFYLAREQDGRPVAFEKAPVYSSIGLDAVDAVMHDIVAGLTDQGIVVEGVMNEYGPGQQEISVRHAPPVRAADTQLKLRDTVRGVALRHRLLASFAPKPFLEGIGSGCHVHLSVWSGDGQRNLLYDPQTAHSLSETGRHFIGGVLAHLPALIALTCPSYNSYRRLQPHAWSSVYTAWGIDNREAAVRLASPFWGREDSSLNVELKSVDGSANPYLALGGIVACGLDGIVRGLEPGEPCDHDPAHLSEQERQDNGIRRLPQTMTAALEQLGGDPVLMEALGPFLSQSYLMVRRSEAADFALHDDEYELQHHFYKF